MNGDVLNLVFWSLMGIVFLLIVLYVWFSIRNTESGTNRYAPRRGKEQWEVDLRLPYKRFKELYPWTEITFEQYKKMQMERAFRRALSSQKNKRMVR